MSEKCTWKDDCDWWESTCKEAAFTFNDGGPVSNGFKFCPHCGLELDEYSVLKEGT